MEGHSGSIVYYVSKKRNGQILHYPWGMLVEHENILYDGETITVYGAVVLNQAFQDVARAYPNVGQFELFKVHESSTPGAGNLGRGPVPPRQ